MNKRHTVSGTNEENILILAGETNAADKGVLFCDVVMISIFVWNQFQYGMDMLFLIIPLLLIGIWIAVFALIPENYRFTELSLEVTHKFRKTLQVPYESVFNYDATTRDTFINILRKNAVKVYYCTASGKKRVVLCTPRDVETFTEVLRAKCPEFYDEEPSNGLQVFFNHRNNKGDQLE